MEQPSCTLVAACVGTMLLAACGGGNGASSSGALSVAPQASLNQFWPSGQSLSRQQGATDLSGSVTHPGGNIYLADAGSHAIKEILAVGGYKTIKTLNTQINEPAGIAQDALGNLYVGGVSDNNVYEILKGGGYKNVRILGSGFCTPYGVAVDANANVFVGDSCNHAVKEMLAVDGRIPNSPTILTLGSGFMYPTFVALDANDDVFVSDTSAPAGNGFVKEILADDYTTVNTLGGGFHFNNPSGISLDANANVYIADPSAEALYEIPSAGGYASVNTLASGLSSPYALAVDPSGNAYYGPYSGTSVDELVAASGYTNKPIGSGFLGVWGLALQYPALQCATLCRAQPRR